MVGSESRIRTKWEKISILDKYPQVPCDDGQKSSGMTRKYILAKESIKSVLSDRNSVGERALSCWPPQIQRDTGHSIVIHVVLHDCTVQILEGNSWYYPLWQVQLLFLSAPPLLFRCESTNYIMLNSIASKHFLMIQLATFWQPYGYKVSKSKNQSSK